MSARTEIKLRIHTILEQIFPEYEHLFCEIWGSSSMALLSKYLLPENIANASLDELHTILLRNSHNRFKNSSSLVAYAGIDPTVRQSGEYCSAHNRMSKRGSSHLRHTLFLAASCCVFHNSPFNEYYLKKRSQGKHHLVAVGAVSRKLTTVVYAILKSGKPYEPIKFV